jgi:hypothetical protein
MEFARCNRFPAVQRAFWRQFGRRGPPEKSIRRWYEQFRYTGCICHQGKGRAGRPSVTEETVNIVRETFRAPGNMCRQPVESWYRSPVWKILRNDYSCTSTNCNWYKTPAWWSIQAAGVLWEHAERLLSPRQRNRCCNVWVCVCVDFVMCVCVCMCMDFVMCGHVCMCGFCSVCVDFIMWGVCIWVGSAMCGCVCMCGFCNVCVLVICILALSPTLTEVFPCFFLSCKANARVKPAKTGHGPHFCA